MKLKQPTKRQIAILTGKVYQAQREKENRGMQMCIMNPVDKQRWIDVVGNAVRFYIESLK